MRLLTITDVESKVSFGKSKIYAMIKNDGFPAPIKIGYSARWLESSIDVWIGQVAKLGA
ncbi:AlpA family phage regulatory protein [Chitinimonas arctica]|uniref:AlpA family phage regulatory protein n=1 Tax=Chitinimonas arctica TaxID=2594795 RepID=A0A516SAZ2_9NEIS|nr:AlpA family phage regulatory protein [Chitinimonas arctica]QDQ25320.1 AlpA family phage regulatory protein [Chitinimonas arctica]